SYPTRLLRYLIPCRWLLDIHSHITQPLLIAEIGTGSGQMKSLTDFIATNTLFFNYKRSAVPLYSRWDAFDIAPNTLQLSLKNYHSINHFDANLDIKLDFSNYNIFLLLHILEHLQDPPLFCQNLTRATQKPSYFIIGVPSLPDFLAGLRQKQLRRKYLSGGHWCKFSPARLRHLASTSGWSILQLTGAFLTRLSGNPLEDSRFWFKFNLILANLLPTWPGEVYLLAYYNPNSEKNSSSY
ncbi:MAG: class I SAM-dependent methyltransferase, partial [Chthoniobacterales bacterium]|nr:class I SAM-dependent methyltransferase [Chthoniobacterales bacterium]